MSKARATTDRLQPYQQGGLDALCGPYAVVNALRLVETLETRRFSGMGGPPFIRPNGTRAVRYQGADLLAFIAEARRTSTSS